jgi:DNA-binding NtrC family response regulator
MLVSAKKRRETGAICRTDLCDQVQQFRDDANNGVSTETPGANGLQTVPALPRVRAKRTDAVSSISAHARGRQCDIVVSKNPRMSAIFDLLYSVAQSSATVLIEGETGTGKEIVARALHEASPQRSGPMVAVNCAALSEQLIESELFGHEKGAFTSAASQRKGRFELAEGGTLFLDEVGDIPAAMQCKLLRVLQERCFERVGGTRAIAVNVRVVAATNRCLKDLVRAGKFREDLYYRLDVVKIDLPPLRERLEDIPLLALHFAAKYARPGEEPRGIAPRVLQMLQNYRWPGNVRQLENAIERACAVTRGNTIRQKDLPPELKNSNSAWPRIDLNREKPVPALLRDTAALIEEKMICDALDESRGQIDRTAKLCDQCREIICAMLLEYGIGTARSKDA